MLRISYVIFNNIYTNRIRFYRNIYNHIQENGRDFLSENELLQLGNRAGLSTKHTKEELIGCLYAPFLVKYDYSSQKYFVTNNARLKFSDLLTRGRYQKYELGIVLNEDDQKVFRLIIDLTDCLSEELINKLLDRGWTRNKSKFRLMKKTKMFEKIGEELTFLMNNLSIYQPNEVTFEELLREHGRYWRQMNSYTGNFMAKACYESELIPMYTHFFEDLLGKCVQPIDWQGTSISKNDFADLIKRHNISTLTEQFIFECIKDGLIRHCDSEYFTLTSTGYFLMRSYLAEKKTARSLNFFLRRVEKDRYLLMVGENTLFNSYKQNYLQMNFEYDSRGWFEVEDDEETILLHLSSLCNQKNMTMLQLG